eukprot:TRINITY_DN3494_c0_g1_i1.p1 TRINITY_DN3494_c0_g1~~TRINITY_DN3494_c0_g1_i1.p1  ORF type:complete len:263 (-),score=62.88 TRINITY_DN3494_c0_g1_i1:278-1066(-)
MIAIKIAMLMVGSMIITQAAAECRVEASLHKRENQGWVDGNERWNNIYDINVHNIGTCTITHVNIELLFGDDAEEIVKTWNMQAEVTEVGWKVAGFGEGLQPGQTFQGAGFILAMNSTDGEPIVASSSVICASDCLAPTFVFEDECDQKNCTVTATRTLRTTFMNGEYLNVVFDVTFTNIGHHPAGSSDIAFEPAHGSKVSQVWNMVAKNEGHDTKISSFNTPLFNLQPGNIFVGAGYILTVKGDKIEEMGVDIPVFESYCL